MAPGMSILASSSIGRRGESVKLIEVAVCPSGYIRLNNSGCNRVAQRGHILMTEYVVARIDTGKLHAYC